jgi:hypothetical protein
LLEFSVAVHQSEKWIVDPELPKFRKTVVGAGERNIPVHRFQQFVEVRLDLTRLMANTLSLIDIIASFHLHLRLSGADVTAVAWSQLGRVRFDPSSSIEFAPRLTTGW